MKYLVKKCCHSIKKSYGDEATANIIIEIVYG